jgi:mono/diheme cytochrome c family protein
MKRVLKWVGIVLGAIIALLLAVVVVVYAITEMKRAQTYTVPVEAVAVPADAESIALGEHVLGIRGCTDCHGADYAGAVFIDDPLVGTLSGSNLTSGLGGIGGSYTVEDWVRAIRHGILPNGRSVIFMPSQEFQGMSNRDLGAAIAFLQALPPVDKVVAAPVIGPLARAIYLFDGGLVLFPAEVVDHTAKAPEHVEVAASATYGEYLAQTCTGCHGMGLSGGPIPGAPPDFKVPLNLTPAGNLASWSEADFINTMRTGVTPDGRQLDAQYMPWPGLGAMKDVELQAVFAYLQTLPPAPLGSR